MPKHQIIEMKVSDIVPYAKNPRKNDEAVEYVANSIKEFGFKSPIIVDRNHVIIAGHTRLKAAKSLGMATVPVIVADDLTEEQARAYRIADNSTGEVAEWEFGILADEIIELDDYDFEDFGIQLHGSGDTVDFDNLESRMGETSEEHQQFLDKFKPKHTTDDCFTPPRIYEAVKEWVFSKYCLPEDTVIVRPFFPGGDYKAHDYPEGCLVLDNPPFSIMSEILDFYLSKGIRFFLFANHLTLFSSFRKAGTRSVVCGNTITYENGATVTTSFITSLGDDMVTISGSLADTLDEIDQEGIEKIETKAYAWPPNVENAARLGTIASAGLDMTIRKVVPISQMDDGTEIFGSGILISDADAERADAERAKAERAKVERAKVPVSLSPRERAIIEELNREGA